MKKIWKNMKEIWTNVKEIWRHMKEIIPRSPSSPTEALGLGRIPNSPPLYTLWDLEDFWAPLLYTSSGTWKNSELSPSMKALNIRSDIFPQKNFYEEIWEDMWGNMKKYEGKMKTYQTIPSSSLYTGHGAGLERQATWSLFFGLANEYIALTLMRKTPK